MIKLTTYIKEKFNFAHNAIKHLRYKKNTQSKLDSLVQYYLNNFGYDLNSPDFGIKKPIIEIITQSNINDASYRLKIDTIFKTKMQQFDFRRYPLGGQSTVAILVHKRSSLYALCNTQNNFRDHRPNAVVMLFVSDLVFSEAEKYRALPDFLDIIFVPTMEMKIQLEAFVSCRVEILKDPIELNSNKAIDCRESTYINSILKVAWFGYPESYTKSMLGYENLIRRLVISKAIEFHVITKSKRYGNINNITIHEYSTDTFNHLLTSFDICVLSHTPFDFSMSTYWKSENKAALAISLGIPVIATKTPAYSRLLTRFNLTEYLFSTEQELTSAIEKLRCPQTRKAYLNQIQNHVISEYSPQSMTEEWLHIFNSAQSKRNVNKKFIVNS